MALHGVAPQDALERHVLQRPALAPFRRFDGGGAGRVVEQRQLAEAVADTEAKPCNGNVRGPPRPILRAPRLAPGACHGVCALNFNDLFVN